MASGDGSSRLVSPRGLWIALGACVVLALASLALPYEPAYDAWAWLVWGREVAGLELDTSAGPSWKPLPVLVTALAAPLGDGAREVWLFVARFGWLAGPVLAAWVGARLLGPASRGWRVGAGALAAVSVALVIDVVTPVARQVAGGLSEPLLVALVLGAVALHLAQRTGAALAAGLAGALLRPESWPFLAVYAWWIARREPRLRIPAVVVIAAIPLAWFVPDLIASGDALTGAASAIQVRTPPPGQVLLDALVAPLPTSWLGLVIAIWSERGARSRPLTVLGIAACAWIAIAVAMAAVGYAGLPRFVAPASAVISVVGAVGLVLLARRAVAAARRGGDADPRGPRRAATPIVLGALAALALAGVLAGTGLRVATLPDDLRTARERSRAIEQLLALVDVVGAERLSGCDGLVRTRDLVGQSPLAWRLDLPMSAVRVVRVRPPGLIVARSRLAGPRVARVGAWRALEFPCPRRPTERPAR